MPAKPKKINNNCNKKKAKQKEITTEKTNKQKADINR